MAAGLTRDESADLRLIKAIKFAHEYINGKTLKEIGDENGVTREWVRQLLASIGVVRRHGGAAVKAAERAIGIAREKIKAKSIKESKWEAFFGCSMAEVESINGKPWSATDRHSIKNGSAVAFYNQKKSAEFRGIPFEITYPEWWDVWDQSGKWEQRGRGQGYCMARIGDTGPYAKDNVEIKTIGENFSESFYKHPHEARRQKAIENGRTYFGFLKKTHCKRGHDLSVTRNKHGCCSECNKIRQQKYYAIKKAKLTHNNFVEAV